MLCEKLSLQSSPWRGAKPLVAHGLKGIFIHVKKEGHPEHCIIQIYNGHFTLHTLSYQRTSDGGNGNHSVSLPIILIEIKVDQMLPSSYISSLFVPIL